MPRLREEQRITLPTELRKRILRDSGYRCAHCNILLKHTKDDDFSIEHVVPLRKGGRNNPNNLIALCKACNMEKQDDIIDPRTYYTYAPEWKLNEICQTFDNYIQNVDWVAYDTLFKLDRFDLRAQKSFLNKKSNKIFHIPATYQVRKLRREQALEFLVEYTGHLDTLDKSQMAYELDEITTSYYAIMGAGQTIMVVSPYIMNTSYGLEDDTNRMAIFLDFFVNQNIPIRPPGSHATIAHILDACCTEIRKTIELRTPRDKSCIDCILRTPYSDEPAKNGLRMFQRQYHTGNTIFINGQEDEARNIDMILRFYNGTLDDLVTEAKAEGKRRSEYAVNIQERQDGIKERLEKSREISNEKIEKIKRKDKKAKHKKKRHK